MTSKQVLDMVGRYMRAGLVDGAARMLSAQVRAAGARNQAIYLAAARELGIDKHPEFKS